MLSRLRDPSNSALLNEFYDNWARVLSSFIPIQTNLLDNQGYYNLEWRVEKGGMTGSYTAPLGTETKS
jgi:hypothetical protein